MRVPVQSFHTPAWPQTTVAVRHRRGIRPEKGESIEIELWRMVIIQFSRLRLVDDLPRFVEALQGKRVVGEILVPTTSIRRKAHGLLALLQPFHTVPVRQTRCPN
jgi:hypothetical protein